MYGSEEHAMSTPGEKYAVTGGRPSQMALSAWWALHFIGCSQIRWTMHFHAGTRMGKSEM